jgi:hypothetical protein
MARCTLLRHSLRLTVRSLVVQRMTSVTLKVFQSVWVQGCKVLIAIERAKLVLGKPDPDSAYWN